MVNESTRKQLWSRSGERCAKCKEKLTREAISSERGVLIGEECHIRSPKENGPRFDPSYPKERINSIDNLVVLCANCHTEVDANTEDYTVERLIAIKSEHENNDHKSIGFVTQKNSKYPFNLSPGNYVGGTSKSRLVDRVGVLHDLCERAKVKSKPIYLYSFGGLGKSAIAQEYCDKDKSYAENFEWIFWIEANQASKDVRVDLMKAPVFDAFKLEIDDNNKENIERNYNRFADEGNLFLEKGEVLLIIDNITEKKQMDSIKELISRLHWKIIVTTRFKPEEIAHIEDRVITVLNMGESDCEELFYENYFDEELKKNDDLCQEIRETSYEALREIIKITDHHTKLVSHLGKCGKDNDFSVEEILEMLQKDGFSNEDLQYLDEAGRYQRVYEIVASIYDFDRLEASEKLILGYFALLPDTFIPEKKLIEWMKDERFDKRGLQSVFEGLLRRGWLEKGFLVKDKGGIKSKERTYKCHSIAQQGILLKIKNKREAAEGLIQGLIQFLSIGAWEDYYTCLVPYFDSVWSVLEHLKGVVDSSVVTLKKQFIRKLTLSDTSSIRAYELATSLLNEFLELFPEDSGNDQINNRIEVYLVYASACSAGKQDDTAYSEAFIWRNKARDLADAYLSKSDPLNIWANRAFAISLRITGEYDKALSIYSEIQKHLNIEFCSNNKEYAYQLDQTFAGAGLTLSRQARLFRCNDKLKDAVELNRRALVIRKERLKITKELFGDSSRFYAGAKNDLAMSHLFLYRDGDDDFEHLVIAEELLLDSIRTKKAYYGTEMTAGYALSLNNLGFLFTLKNDFVNAFIHLNHALDIRKQVLGEGWFRGYSLSYLRIGEAYRKLWEATGNTETLYEAQSAFREANRHISKKTKDVLNVDLLEARKSLAEINMIVDIHEGANNLQFSDKLC